MNRRLVALKVVSRFVGTGMYGGALLACVSVLRGTAELGELSAGQVAFLFCGFAIFGALGLFGMLGGFGRIAEKFVSPSLPGTAQPSGASLESWSKANRYGPIIAAGVMLAGVWRVSILTIPIICVIALVVALIELMQWIFGDPSLRHPPTDTREEIADLIERFINGRVGPYEWDDFISVDTGDPELDAVRQRCSDVGEEFKPPRRVSAYCTEEGTQVLRELARKLREDR